MTRRRLLLLPALLCVVGLAACDTLGYYQQAVGGQLRLLGQRQDIDRLLQSDSTSPQLQSRLRSVQNILAFAEEALALPAGSQFTTYVELAQPYVVWNVFAAPEFSMQPLRWCYPVAGCVSYRGWFDEADALRHAHELEEEGHDVFVGGVAAYSTLGWFSDPVLSTVINRPEHRMAMLLFHELAHQLLYVSGDTGFSESYATAVEQLGLEQWLASRNDEEHAYTVLSTVAQEQARQAAFVDLVQGAVEDLDHLYQSDADPGALRAAKAQRIEELRAQYRRLQQDWDGDGSYDQWFAGPINNARLLTVTTYNEYVPAFRALFERCEAQWPCFHARARELARLDAAQRQAELAAVLEFPLSFRAR